MLSYNFIHFIVDKCLTQTAYFLLFEGFQVKTVIMGCRENATTTAPLCLPGDVTTNGILMLTITLM